jgi:hypothetical protein
MMNVLNRQGIASILLLAAGLALPESWPLMGLRESKPLASELSQARANGYYEGLLASSSTESSRRLINTSPKVVPAPPGWKPFVESGLVETVTDYRRWRLRPNVEVQWNGSTVRVNSLRCRSPEVPREKPAGTYRVVVLGSSNSLGHGVNDEDIYLRHLEHWLNEAGDTALKVDVINLSISAASPTQRLFRLANEVEELDPDWIVCDASALDFSLEELHLSWAVHTQIPIPFAFVRECLDRAGVTATNSPEEFARKLQPVQETLLDGAYAGWSEQARRLGVPLSIVLLPRADMKVENPYIFALMKQAARRHGLEVIDLSGIFRDWDLDTIRVAPWDQHPSRQGHRIIFDQLREALRERGGPPGLTLPGRRTAGGSDRDPSSTPG